MNRTEKDLRAAIEREMPGVRADLERLIRIPGIAFDGFDHSHVERSAAAVAELSRGCELHTRVVRAGGRPAVLGRRPAPPGAPTVLLYAHHDIQPAGDITLWASDPFEPVERDGRLYGRGAADDKAGVMTHVAALRALGDDVPVGVVLFIEGEEEYGSESLDRLITDHADWLHPDVIVIADSDNWDIGRPALTTSLRGMVSCFVEVRTLGSAVHSGMFGGPVPDANQRSRFSASMRRPPARHPTPWRRRQQPRSAYGWRPATTHPRRTRPSALTSRGTCRGEHAFG
jgi:acetylornithine deacetylase/succinyl-diaminopimelate desuccinylase-like protein